MVRIICPFHLTEGTDTARFDDCLKLGKRIDERPYLLPDPELLRKRSDEDVTTPTTAQINGAMSPHPNFLPTPADEARPSERRLDVFNAKRIMLSSDLALGSRLKAILETLIEEGGGSIATNIHEADFYICRYREGRDYIVASRSKKDVGNLSWLYYLITKNEWTSPFRRLLHYPTPHGCIPGFEKFRITLSNYGGEARLYLENLVVAAGAEFTKTMKQDNTHLITARKASEKCAAAEEWNIEMVNHLWIEESYAKCAVQPLSVPRYSHFPARTNLGEVIGQTQFDEAVLENIYYPPQSLDSADDIRQVREALETKDQNALSLKTSGKDIIVGPQLRPEFDLQKDNASNIIQKTKGLFGVPPPARKRTAVTTPTINRTSNTGKENDTPSSTSSRGAKDRALSKLHDLAPDMALYEKEKKRGGSIWGGKRALDQVDKGITKKRPATPPDESGDSSDDGQPAVKRAKTALPPIQMQLLITGWTRWLSDVHKEDHERVKISLTTSTRLC